MEIRVGVRIAAIVIVGAGVSVLSLKLSVLFRP